MCACVFVYSLVNEHTNQNYLHIYVLYKKLVHKRCNKIFSLFLFISGQLDLNKKPDSCFKRICSSKLLQEGLLRFNATVLMHSLYEWGSFVWDLLTERIFQNSNPSILRIALLSDFELAWFAYRTQE